jgi:hypothetical protein
VKSSYDTAILDGIKSWSELAAELGEMAVAIGRMIGSPVVVEVEPATVVGSLCLRDTETVCRGDVVLKWSENQEDHVRLCHLHSERLGHAFVLWWSDSLACVRAGSRESLREVLCSMLASIEVGNKLSEIVGQLESLSQYAACRRHCLDDLHRQEGRSCCLRRGG